jgi:hypothetical protein
MLRCCNTNALLASSGNLQRSAAANADAGRQTQCNQ